MSTHGIFIGQLVVFVVFNGFVALASLIIVHRFGKRQLSWSELVVGASLLFASLIAGCAILLGALGRLSYESLLVGTTLIVACLLILLRRTGPLTLPAGNPVKWIVALRGRGGSISPGAAFGRRDRSDCRDLCEYGAATTEWRRSGVSPAVRRYMAANRESVCNTRALLVLSRHV